MIAGKYRKILRIIGGFVLTIVICRLVIPIPMDGYWRSIYSECLCDSENTCEYSGGRVYIYSAGHGKHHSLEGTYRRIGWNKYEWSRPTEIGGQEKVILRPGWLFLGADDVEGGSAIGMIGIREALNSRVERIKTASKNNAGRRSSPTFQENGRASAPSNAPSNAHGLPKANNR
jgi:hypothetical protein